MTVEPTTQPAPGATGDSTSIASGAGFATRTYGFFRNNMKITIGLFLVLIVVAFGYLGPFFVDLEKAEVGSVLPPGKHRPLKTGSVPMHRGATCWHGSSMPRPTR